jgi:hypothetical protein
MSFGRPHIKCLLCQVARVGLGVCQAESELVERLVKASYYAFKVLAWTHTSMSSLVGATTVQKVPAVRDWRLLFPNAFPISRQNCGGKISVELRPEVMSTLTPFLSANGRGRRKLSFQGSCEGCATAPIAGTKLRGSSLISMGRAIHWRCRVRSARRGGARRTLWPRVKPIRKRIRIVFRPAEFWIQPVRVSGYPQRVYLRRR